MARSCTEAQPIDNEEGTDPKCDQAVGHNMQHASSLVFTVQHGTKTSELKTICSTLSAPCQLLAAATTPNLKRERSAIRRSSPNLWGRLCLDAAAPTQPGHSLLRKTGCMGTRPLCGWASNF